MLPVLPLFIALRPLGDAPPPAPLGDALRRALNTAFRTVASAAPRHIAESALHWMDPRGRGGVPGLVLAATQEDGPSGQITLRLTIVRRPPRGAPALLGAALQHMAQRGLGWDEHQTPHEVVSVSTGWPHCPGTAALLAGDWPAPEGLDALVDPAPPGEPLTVQLVSPLVLRTRLPALVPDPLALFQAGIARIGRLAELEGHRARRHLHEPADAVVDAADVRWVPQTLVGRRSPHEVRRGGVTGTVHYSGDLGDLPWVAGVLELLQVGRGLSAGFGQLKVLSGATVRQSWPLPD